MTVDIPNPPRNLKLSISDPSDTLDTADTSSMTTCSIPQALLYHASLLPPRLHSRMHLSYGGRAGAC